MTSGCRFDSADCLQKEPRQVFGGRISRLLHKERRVRVTLTTIVAKKTLSQKLRLSLAIVHNGSGNSVQQLDLFTVPNATVRALTSRTVGRN